MKIICGYTAEGFKQQARDAIAKFAPDCKLLDFTGCDFDYARAVARYWKGIEDLVIIEHDNVITKDVIPSFASCNEPWCTYAYPCAWNGKLQRLTWGLGCVKFSAELQRQAPLPGESLPDTVYWAAVDGMIHDYLTISNDFSPHVHGDIKHLHEYGPTKRITSFGYDFLNKLGGADGA
jgi:hypothetical protein